jgi:cell division protein ZapA
MQTAEGNHALTITLLDKQHTIACPKGQEQALLEAADKLNVELLQLKQTSQFKSDDKLFLLAALNLCHQLLTLESEHSKHAQSLLTKLTSALG